MESFHGGSDMAAALGAEDLQEEEVWAVMNARDQGSSSITRKNNHLSGSSSGRARGRAIPRAASGVQEYPSRRSSAPVHIPDWSKILKKLPNKNPWDDSCDAADDDDGGGRDSNFISIHVRDNDDDDGDLVPPHEYLARRLATTQIASFSMCEGVGGTLKGRDLSRLRNAILTKTGFIE